MYPIPGAIASLIQSLMAYNETLALAVSEVLSEMKIEPEEKKMFGGIAYMVKGHMMVGVTKDDLMTRTTLADYEKALEMHHTRPMDFTGKVMHGFLFVSGIPLLQNRDLLRAFIDLSWKYVNSPEAAAAAAKKAAKAAKSAKKS